MAIDEAILRARIEEKVPNTVRFYCWHPSAVSIGRFQDIHKEVHLANCRNHGVSVVRRISGGGAVYHDSQGEVTYSTILRRQDIGIDDIAKAYKHICGGLIEAAHSLGICVEYSKGGTRQCPNLTVKNRKISGSAQANKRGTILQHGTFLLNVDLKKMFMFLKVPWKDGCADFDTMVSRRITSVSSELDEQVSVGQIYKAMTEGFEKTFDVELSEGSLTKYESTLAEELVEGKFATQEWNFEGRLVSKF